MKSLAFVQAEESLIKWVRKNAPAILIWVGTGGTVLSFISAIKETPKAMKLIEARKEEEKRELTKKEVVQTCWKTYLGPVMTLGVSVGCILGGNSMYKRRGAALLAAYVFQERYLKDYQEKTKNLIGNKKEKAVRDEVAREQLQRTPPSQNIILPGGKGKTLCFDPVLGKSFYSDIESLRKIQNNLNYRMTTDWESWIPFNEYYSELNLQPTDVGWQLGWNVGDGLIDMDFSSQLTEEGEPCLVVGFFNPPSYEFRH